MADHREEKIAVAIQTQTSTDSHQDRSPEEKVRRLRELFADAPEIGKAAMENALRELRSGASSSWMSEPRTRMEGAGRIGRRQGTVSELTLIAPFSEGGAQRLRGFLELREGNFDD